MGLLSRFEVIHMQAGRRGKDKVQKFDEDLVHFIFLPSFLTYFSHCLLFYSYTCSTFHTATFFFHSFNLTLHLSLANSGLISCGLHMEISVSHFFYMLWDLTAWLGEKVAANRNFLPRFSLWSWAVKTWMYKLLNWIANGKF